MGEWLRFHSGVKSGLPSIEIKMKAALNILNQFLGKWCDFSNGNTVRSATEGIKISERLLSF